MNIYDLKTIVIDCNRYSYFYKREKNDVNGNPRFRAWLFDPDNIAVYEKVIKCYESQIHGHLEEIIQRRMENEI